MKSVLFLCVANSARSQIAEALGRKLYGAKYRFQSAGSMPGKVNPYAIRVLEEFEADVAGLHSKAVAEIEPGSFDAIIFLCAEEACPIAFEDVPRLHWPVPDPASTLGSEEHVLHAFRATRDRIYVKLRNLEKELLSAAIR